MPTPPPLPDQVVDPVGEVEDGEHRREDHPRHHVDPLRPLHGVGVGRQLIKNRHTLSHKLIYLLFLELFYQRVPVPVVPPVLAPAPAVLVAPSRPPVLERLEELRQRPREGRGEGQLRVRLRRRRRGGGGRARRVGGGGRGGAPLAGVEEEVGGGGLAADAPEEDGAAADAVAAVGGAVAHRGLD